MTKTDELFETITKNIIDLIEGGEEGKWNKPWTTLLGQGGLQSNATTKKAYTGMNQMVLMATSALEGHGSPEWATYRQFAGVDAQVRKGEKGTKLVRWGVTYRCSVCKFKSGKGPCPTPGHDSNRNLWATGFTVFNADQVDGYESIAPETIEDLGKAPEKVAEVEAFIAKTGATIKHVAGDRAFYMPSTDAITLPLEEQFDTTEGYYGTKLHELTHWSGGTARLDRTVGSVFGDAKYAAEELVAELGSVFLSAQFGIEVEPHPEHAAYLASWVRMMKDTPKALYTAAKLAQEAVNHLNEYSTTEEEVAA